jgi:HPt (histidine-containing phosphotransfer) domain-containing protein
VDVIRVDAELEPLVPRFLEKRRAEADVLRQAIEHGDLETVQALGHALKGTAGGYGFDYLTELGDRLERAAASGDAGEAGAIVAEIRSHLSRLRVVYV